MFDIKVENSMDLKERLLYNIMEQLIELNENVSKLNIKETKSEVIEVKEETKKYKCKICNKEYDNTGKMLACLKKHKKESGSK